MVFLYWKKCTGVPLWGEKKKWKYGHVIYGRGRANAPGAENILTITFRWMERRENPCVRALAPGHSPQGSCWRRGLRPRAVRGHSVGVGGSDRYSGAGPLEHRYVYNTCTAVITGLPAWGRIGGIAAVRSPPCALQSTLRVLPLSRSCVPVVVARRRPITVASNAHIPVTIVAAEYTEHRPRPVSITIILRCNNVTVVLFFRFYVLCATCGTMTCGSKIKSLQLRFVPFTNAFLVLTSMIHIDAFTIVFLFFFIPLQISIEHYIFLCYEIKDAKSE